MAKARISIERFGGMIPRTSERALPPTHAAKAQNAKLHSGEIRGLRGLKPLHQFAYYNIKRSYRLVSTTTAGGEHWIGFNNPDISVHRGPLINDAYDRYYKFGDGVPEYNTLERLKNNQPWLLLGVPAPENAPQVVVTGGTAPDVDRSYVYTFVSEFGEESAPSPVTSGTGPDDATWTLSSMDITMPQASRRLIAKKRIYRTIVGFSSVDFYFVDEVDIVDSEFVDTETDETVSRNSILESTLWTTPPEDIEGVVMAPNGFFAGWAGRDIHFSEPYRPHAWPAQYDLSTEHDVVGMGVFAQSIGVVTKSSPYIGTGLSPSALTLTKINAIEPGLSRHGIVSMAYGVLYPSQNGLILLSPSGVELTTRQLVTKNEWLRDYNPEGLIAAQYQSAYVAFYSETSGIMIDPAEPMATFVELDGFSAVDFVHTDATSGDVFIDCAGIVYLWDAQDQKRLSWRWKSKKFMFQKPCNLGALSAEIDGEITSADVDYIAQLEAYNAQRFAAAPLGALGGNALGSVEQVTLPGDWALFPQVMQALSGSPLFDIEEVLNNQSSLRFKVYADGRLAYEGQYLDEKHLRLPSGFKAKEWQIEAYGTGVVLGLRLAETGRGLEDV